MVEAFLINPPFRMTIALIISGFVAVSLLLYVIFVIVEPIFLFLFNKPLYVHFYPVQRKLSPNQRELLLENFPFYTALSTRYKSYFEHRIVCFIERYQFVGRKIEVTDEMRVLIAATYVMLSFGLRKYLIAVFEVIIIYPTAYDSDGNGVFHKGELNIKAKAIVFSWEDFMSGLQTKNDNINLGLHEFAHALQVHGVKSKDASAIVYHDSFNQSLSYFLDPNRQNELLRKGYFRAYAYENEFEFMAVVLEHFFESPLVFKANHPELYQHVVRMLNYKSR